MPDDLTRGERALLAFYRGEGRTDRGYTVPMILGWADDVWEYVHDYIQWAFPNDRSSAFNPDAPLLTPNLVKLWAADPVLGENLELLFARWLRFAGLVRYDAGGFLFATPTNLGVWERPNHNWLRVTRVLKCLRLLHRGDDARRLLAFLEGGAVPRFGIDEGTLRYWRGAAG